MWILPSEALSELVLGPFPKLVPKLFPKLFPKGLFFMCFIGFTSFMSLDNDTP